MDRKVLRQEYVFLVEAEMLEMCNLLSWEDVNSNIEDILNYSPSIWINGFLSKQDFEVCLSGGNYGIKPKPSYVLSNHSIRNHPDG